MRKIIFSVIGLLLLCGTIYATTLDNNEPIKVGFVGCLTGTNSELGVNGMYGAMLAVAEINEKGGVRNQPIELIIKDDQGNPQIGLQEDEALINEECVAIIGHMTSDMAEKSIPFINQQKILMISPTIALDTLSNQDDYFFRLIPSTSEQAKLFSSEIIKLGLNDVLVICPIQNEIFAKSIYNYLSSTLTKEKISTKMLEPIDFTKQSEVDALVSAIIGSDAEALIIIASADAVVQISQLLNAQEKQIFVFLPAWSMTNDLIKRGGSSVNQFYGISYIDYQNTTRAYEDFKNKYIQSYGEEPTFAAVMSYESVMLLYQAMIESDDLTSDHLKQAILEQEVYSGLQGEIHINKFGDTVREEYIYQIIDGNFVKVNDDER
ncbi:MAG: amino acid ABC transporter substrate-binding protein [Clostridia bacterium]|nr:amino acid ABC transporter substrate-binding protein [Clostridia bacterium]